MESKFQRRALRLLLSFAAPKESNKEKGPGNVEFLMINVELDPCG
jgi:hypothetical protein